MNRPYIDLGRAYIAFNWRGSMQIKLKGRPIGQFMH